VQGDVTERKKLEDRLRQSQKMDAVGRLAAGVAHDFNNLLTVVSGHSQLLLRLPDLSPSIRRSIMAINEAGDRASALTRQLLAFSRQTVLQPKVMDVNVVISATGKMLKRLIGEDILFTTVLDPTLSRIKVDPGQLDQILMNLAVNARDAMPKGGSLRIETANVTIGEDHAAPHIDCKPGPQVMLSITDTGSGMTPEVLNCIFEPFFTTKEIGQGTGLGLATVFGIVQQNGGCIHVESEPGQGTTFRIYFPAVVGQEADKSDLAASNTLRGTERILIVEDEEAVRELAVISLEMQGYKVMTATDGKDALRIVRTRGGPIDLVLTDVVMPNISGPELVEKLRLQFPRMKVLFMSGYTDDAVLRRGLSEAYVSFIEKPYTPLALARRVRQVLDSSGSAAAR